MKNFAETHMNVNKRALQFLCDMVDLLQLKLSQACIAMFLNGFIEKVDCIKKILFILNKHEEFFLSFFSDFRRKVETIRFTIIG
jgi:hypothetical protein